MPTSPSGPTGPTNPTAPTTPATPAGPTNPANPVGPTEPTGPTGLTGPTGPTGTEGAPQGATCPTCGVAAPPGGRYCPNCATPLPGAEGPPPTLPPLPTSAPLRPPARAHRRVRGTSGWVKALIVALVVGVVAAVTVAVVVALGVHKATNNFNDTVTPRPGRPSGYHGPGYPGMLVQDLVAPRPGGSIDVNGETLSAGDLTRATSVFGPTLCSPVTVANHALATKDVGPLEWKLQQPNGLVEGLGITGTLQPGQIAPGGTATGTVCFPDTGQSGSFIMLWQPLGRAGRGVWLLRF